LGIKEWQLELLNIERLQTFFTEITLEAFFFILCFFLELEHFLNNISKYLGIEQIEGFIIDVRCHSSILNYSKMLAKVLKLL
jgi:hypothetical protein